MAFLQPQKKEDYSTKNLRHFVASTTKNDEKILGLQKMGKSCWSKYFEFMKKANCEIC